MPVYQYEGVHYELPDGLTNEQAIAKIEAHLGKAPKSQGGFGRNLLGTLEGAGSMIVNTPGMIAGGLAGLGHFVGSGGDIDAATKTQEKVSDTLSYHPRTQEGKDFTNMVSDVASGISNELGAGVENFLQDPYGTKKYPDPNGLQVGMSPKGAAIGRGLAQGTLAVEGAMLGLGAGKKAATRKPSVKPVGADVQGAVNDIITPKKPSVDSPDINLNEGPGLPSTIPVDRNGVAQMLPNDPGMAGGVMNAVRMAEEQKRKAGSQDFLQAKQQEMFGPLMDLEGQKMDLPTPPVKPPIGQQMDMFGPLLDLEQQKMDLPNKPPTPQMDGRQAEMFGPDFTLKSEGEMAPPPFRDPMVSGPQREMFPTDLFELASEGEMAPRQERPGRGASGPQGQLFGEDLTLTPSGEMPPLPENSLYEQVKREAFEQRVEADPRVIEAEKRANAAEEAYLRIAADAQDGRKVEGQLKRLEQEMSVLQELAAMQRKEVRLDLNNQAKKAKEPAAIEPIPRPEPKPLGQRKKKQGGWILIEGKKKKAMENLNDALKVKAKLGELAPSFDTPEAAIEAAKKGKDVEQNLLQRIINYGTKGGKYQALKTHNEVIDYGVDRLNRSDRAARAAINESVHEQYGAALRELSSKEQAELWAVIDLADLHQAPVDLQALAKRGFNEKQIRMAQVHQQEMAKGLVGINRARAAAGKEPINARVAYAAMRASGDFRRLVFDEDKNVVGVIGGDTRGYVNKLKKQFEGKGFTVGEERYYGGMPRERGSANEAFMRAVEMLAENDPKIQNFVDVLNEIRTTEAYNFLNAKTHTMGKKGVFGTTGREIWKSAEENARNGFKSQMNYLEASLKWGELSDAVADIKKVLSSKEVNMPNAKQWMEDYMYNALGFNPSETGRSIEQAIANAFKGAGVGYSLGREGIAMARKVTNAMLLGLNPRFWMTNVIQPLQSMPGMKAMMVARGLDAGFDFGTGYSYLGEGAATVMKKGMGAKLDAFELAAEKYAREAHVYGSDLIEHSNRPSKDAIYYLDKISNAGAASIESGTRQVMFHSFTKMLKENGMKADRALFETAHNLTDMAMNNYSMIDRPKVYHSLGPVGDMAVNLRSYMHNELSRLSLFARMAGENHTLRPVAAQMMSTLVYGGMLGFVAFNELDYAYRMFSKYVLKKPDSLTNQIMKLSENMNKKVYDATSGKVDAPYLASHGVFSMMGVDMTRSLGLTDVVPDSMGELLFPGAGKFADVGESYYNFYKNPSSMNAKRAVKSVLPIPAAGAMDVAAFTKPNGLAVNNDNLRGQAYRNTTDKVAKSLGFQGLNESVQRQKTYNIEKTSRDYADLRMSPLANMRDSFFENGKFDPKDVQAYLKLRGDPNTLSGDLTRFAKEQNMSAEQKALLEAAVSTRVGAQAKAQDYLRMFSK